MIKLLVMCQRFRLRFVFCFVFMLSCGGGGYVVEGAEQIYLLTNLHPDARRVISSVNYTNPPGGALLAICTPVQVDVVRGREIRFTSRTNGLRYRYIMHRSARSGLDSHFQRYFGGGCPDTSNMSPEDQAGIQQGQVFQGMTKQGVIMAIGYPPEHRTPSLDGDVWRYWSTRNGQFEVYFTDGRVSGIRN